MNLIKSLMGRRQFLYAAGAATTMGLGYKKFRGIFNHDIQTNVAMAAEKRNGVRSSFLTFCFYIKGHVLTL